MASGSIRRRKGVRGTTYQVVIERGRTPDGKRDQDTKTFKRRKDAQDYLTKTLNDINTGVYIQPSTMLLSAFAEHWFDTIDVRASSEVHYRSTYKHQIQPAFGHIPLGQIVATPAALVACEEAGMSPLRLIQRHVASDWGDVCLEDRRENEYALVHGFRLLSAYVLSTGKRVWIITEADRSSTCLLLPSEY